MEGPERRADLVRGAPVGSPAESGKHIGKASHLVPCLTCALELRSQAPWGLAWAALQQSRASPTRRLPSVLCHCTLQDADMSTVRSYLRVRWIFISLLLQTWMLFMFHWLFLFWCLVSCYRVSSSKDQDMDIVMIEQLREAVDLLQDPSGYVSFLA